MHFDEMGNPGDQLLGFLKFFGSGEVCARVEPHR